MKTPRPGRTARWVIGLCVTGVLAVLSVTFLAVGLAGLDFSDQGGLDGTATATVLDVDTYQDYYDEDPSVSVDIDFTYDGEHEVTVIDWPSDREAPSEGDRVRVRFDTADPEYTVELDDRQPGDDGPSGTGSETVAFRVAAVDDGTDAAGGGDRYLWAWWVAGGCALGAVLSLAATAVWASRVPAPPRPAPYFGQSPYGQSPYGQSPYGQSPYGGSSYGPAPHGQFPPNLPPYIPPPS